jgi:type IV pilus assembly protein PilX
MNTRIIPSRKQQSGAILVISLLMLLVLTVLGVVMMQTTRMQERMAGNTRDLSAALQGSEAAVRYAEQQLAAYTSRPDTDSTSSCGSTTAANTVCATNALPVAIYDTSQFIWKTQAKLYGHAGSPTTAVAQLPDPPEYTDERLGFIRDNLDTGQDPPEGRDFFQLTGHSTGLSGNTNTVVQSTYARRF